MKLTRSQKLHIAVDFVASEPVTAICTKYNITPGGLRRLRREDAPYREAEAELVEELIDQARLSLRLKARHAVDALTSILACDRQNLTIESGPNGGVIQKRTVDVKLLQEQRLAAATLVTLWMRLEDATQAQENWRSNNLISSTDEAEEDNEDD